MTDATPDLGLPTKVSPLTVLRFQRKTIFVAIAFAVAGLWIAVGFGRWVLGGSIATGVALGLLYVLVSEYWGLKIVVGGATPSRGQMTRSTIFRLATLSVLAIGATVVFGLPDGIGVLFGLAIFRLIALVMTTIPLLKELKNQ